LDASFSNMFALVRPRSWLLSPRPTSFLRNFSVDIAENLPVGESTQAGEKVAAPQQQQQPEEGAKKTSLVVQVDRTKAVMAKELFTQSVTFLGSFKDVGEIKKVIKQDLPEVRRRPSQ